MRFLLLISALLFAMPAAAAPGPEYHSRTGRADAWSGGVRMIPITTPAGNFRVWTQRIGNNPRLKVLLLHGGPAATHEYFEAFQSFFPGEGIEFWMEAMANRLPHGQYLYLPQGSHMAMYDDQDAYFRGLIRFLHGVDRGGRR
jgi:pimeloyl-ACP methyl ester carboxylesterase